ncbi:MAG: NAD(P)/FAD-dependent oxidoreductase [Bacteroidales bacterium]|nr:NAD(P)/FAD-dependent oxidoreductase [Bacteroidales bacterium]
MSKSTVIIGAGIGGLFCGAMLAKMGLEVTILEKNTTIGGGLQSFSRFGEVFDTGMHIIGGMQKGGNIRRICEWLGIMDKVHIADIGSDTIDEVYVAKERKFYHTAKGRDRYMASLAASFPDQKENLERYFEAIYRIVGELDLFALRPSAPDSLAHSEELTMAADAFIAKYIDNVRLRNLLAYMTPLYSGERGTTPAYVHALISVIYIESPSRFAGGSYRFAETLADFIREHGGRIVASDGVEKIHTRDKMITGVSTRKGQFYSADLYIGAIHPCSLISLLDDPAALPKSYRTRLSELKNSFSAFTIYLKLKKNSFRYINHTGYYAKDYENVWDYGNPEKGWPLGFLYMTPPELEQGEYAEKMTVVAPMPWEFVRKWEDSKVGRRGQEYAQWKTEQAEKLLDCLQEIFPGIRDCIEDMNTASPLTIRDFYGVKEGAMFGYSKDCNNLIASHVPVVTKIPNLFLTGQNCNLHGFCGVALTSIKTAEAILGGDSVLNSILEFEKRH